MATENTPIQPIGMIQDMFPLYMGTKAETIQTILSQGEDIFYILGYEGMTIVGEDNKGYKTARTVLYLVKKNIVGYSITPADDNTLGLNQQLEPQGAFLLPKIPWTMAEKMDQFFRKVQKVHGTEAIVMLTYDENYLEAENPSEGWGLIVPRQSNTASHCNYDKANDEAVTGRPDNQILVGSVHSHPGMSAFFSHTDEHDQAGWDGLHITYGWPNQGPTEHYIQLYMGDEKYTFNYADIFEMTPPPQLDDNATDEWMEKVSKDTTPHNTGHSHGAHSGVGFAGTHRNKSTGNPQQKSKPIRLPEGAPNPKENVLVGVVNTSQDPISCPLCETSLIAYSVTKGRCFSCKSFIARDEETLEQYYERYCENGGSEPHLIDPEKAGKPVFFAYRNAADELVFTHDQRAEVAKK